MILHVHVHPRAHQSTVRGWVGDVLHANLRAAPKENEANLELLRFLSELLAVPKTSLRITRGHAARQKSIQIPEGIDVSILVRQ